MLVGLLVLLSCRKDVSDGSGPSPDDRLNELLRTYQEALVNAEYGWKALVYPGGADGGVFLFYFKFNDSNRVEMFADIDSTTAITAMESSYRLKALQQPSLLFDTYSYLHILSDPDAANSGGAYGQGLKSDFEFAIERLSGDTMQLKGRVNGTNAILVKATAKEAGDFYDQQYNNRLFDNIDKYIHYFKKLVIGIREYEMNVNVETHAVKFTWVNNTGILETFTTGFYHTVDGVALSPAFRVDGNNIAALTNMHWDSTKRHLTFQVNGTGADIQGKEQPLKIDKEAPRRWWQSVADINSYWASLEGFHVNGVDDAFGLSELPDFYFMMYRPRYLYSSSMLYDIAAYVKYNSGNPGYYYAHAFDTPDFSTEGKVKFTYYLRIGSIPSPDSSAAHNTRIQLAEPNGYYLVQINEKKYDMVSAKDAKSWITWIR